MLGEPAYHRMTERRHFTAGSRMGTSLARYERSVASEPRLVTVGNTEIFPICCSVNLPLVAPPIIGVGNKTVKPAVRTDQPNTFSDQERRPIYRNLGVYRQSTETKNLLPVATPCRNRRALGRWQPPCDTHTTKPIRAAEQSVQICSRIACTLGVVEGLDELVSDRKINRPHFPFRTSEAIAKRFHPNKFKPITRRLP